VAEDHLKWMGKNGVLWTVPQVWSRDKPLAGGLAALPQKLTTLFLRKYAIFVAVLGMTAIFAFIAYNNIGEYETEEKSIWRQKRATSSNNACPLAQKVGGRLPALPIRLCHQ